MPFNMMLNYMDKNSNFLNDKKYFKLEISKFIIEALDSSKRVNINDDKIFYKIKMFLS